eukprot:gnl/TRDRNA2_/TRDRNA2_174459_c2_seq2.p2 gnl/TRDRNA2_/TRDRNA2_174459_c2~~gnl/TRDRNA2_/TRDRNA2_174459_c2_seq2.p2  ORF type:complete len:202 (-),score=49.94 gnl/TRDRNA2_/TRDRNA2_174459_c2_seq2:394-924(-)
MADDGEASKKLDVLQAEIASMKSELSAMKPHLSAVTEYSKYSWENLGGTLLQSTSVLADKSVGDISEDEHSTVQMANAFSGPLRTDVDDNGNGTLMKNATLMGFLSGGRRRRRRRKNKNMADAGEASKKIDALQAEIASMKPELSAMKSQLSGEITKYTKFVRDWVKKVQSGAGGG